VSLQRGRAEPPTRERSYPADTKVDKKTSRAYRVRKSGNKTDLTGRPTKLGDAVRERIERELADGIPIAIVAQNVGVARSTLHEWIATGRAS
jgi:hypothetical protein